MIKTLIGLLGLMGLVAYGVEEGGAMSAAYWRFWNPEVQAHIDADICSNRMADACLNLSAKSGTAVTVEQTSHAFLFGGNIFLFGDLKTPRDSQ